MSDERELVGCLEVRWKGAEPDGTQCRTATSYSQLIRPERSDLIDIYGNEQFYVGRDELLCRHHWADPTISKRHLRIHCLLYEKDPVSNIPPFVYATDLSSNGTHLKKQGEASVLMGGASCSVLLDDNDELRISENITLIFHDLKAVNDHQFTWTQEREKQFFADRYLLTGRLIGKGGYGKVLIGRNKKTRRQLACKMINLRGLYNGMLPPNLRFPAEKTQDSLTTGTRKRWPSKVMRCFREFDVLKGLSHPNIISVEKVFWTSSSIYIFEEFITGGDLFSYIEYKGGHLQDVEAAVIVRQILIGIEYLHSHGIVHRDLKPDNVLMTSLEDGARIVITDFGNARYVPKGTGSDSYRLASKSRMFSLVGTLEFAAPEIHQMNPTIPSGRGYSKAVDIWSIGCITAALLTGDVIFTDRAHPDYDTNPLGIIMKIAGRCDLSVIDDETDCAWRKVGHRPKDFIKKLLVLREAHRMTATQALAHPWFSNSRHASEFEALYQRSIEHWQPRPQLDDLVERIRIEAVKAEQPHQTMSHYFKLKSLPRVHSGKSECIAYPERCNLTKQLFTVAEEHEEYCFEGRGNYEQQLNNVSTNDPSYSEVPNHSHRGNSVSGSMNQLSLDCASPPSDPPASGMYSTDDIQGEYAFGEDVEVSCSQDSIDSRLPLLETQWGSSIVYETPVEKSENRPLSPENAQPPYKSYVPPKPSLEDHAVSKRRKLASSFY